MIEALAISVSSAALALSVFTFYWLHLRRVRKLYLLRIDSLGGFSGPEFALVNGGSSDLLITGIECGFKDPDENGTHYPAQTLNVGDASSLILAPGKSVHCKVTFPEKFTETFVKGGTPSERSHPTIYERDLEVRVSWVEGTGDTKTAYARPSRYGFRESAIVKHTPMKKRFDLYGSP